MVGNSVKRYSHWEETLPTWDWLNRRGFLQQTARIAVGVSSASLWMPHEQLMAQISSIREPGSQIDDPRLKILIQRGLDASRTAGANYSDIRLTHSYTREFRNIREVRDIESMAVGVRALVDGYWGFASGPVWNIDEMVRLGLEAVRLTKINALGHPRSVTLPSIPIVRDGHWTTPIQIDPFSVHPFEVADILGGIGIYAQNLPDITGCSLSATFFKQDKAFGSSEGSYFTQRRYVTSGSIKIRYNDSQEREHEREVSGLEQVGVGFELFDEPKLHHAIDTTIEEIKADLSLPVSPVEVGRYEVLLDPSSTAAVLDGSIGIATELDRALGYEANATGTSYINEPLEMLGDLEIASPLLTVTMNRNEPGGLATVQWDDDGVVPESIALVRAGKLNGFQTTREGAGWLNAHAANSGTATQSGGCSYAPSAMDAPLAHTANLIMQPSLESTSLDDMMRSMKKGILFTGLGVGFDFQLRTGIAMGNAYEIFGGKKVARLEGAAVSFQSTEFWKSLSAIGGKNSVHRSVGKGMKGEPRQSSLHSVTAVPSMIKQQSVIDIRRKA